MSRNDYLTPSQDLRSQKANMRDKVYNANDMQGTISSTPYCDSEILHPFPPRVVSLNVYATPYAFTPNNQPLYLRYGTIPAAEAADAAYYIISSANNSLIQRNNFPQEIQQDNLKSQCESKFIALNENNIECSGSKAHEFEKASTSNMFMGNTDPHLKKRQQENDISSTAPKSRRTERCEKEIPHRLNDAKPAQDVLENPNSVCQNLKDTVSLDNIPKEVKRIDRTNLLTKPFSENSNSGDDQAAKRGRMVWVPELHELFLNAIKKIGIEKAVPTTILQEMQEMKVTGLSRDNVASHLQKYRLGIQKEREEQEKESLCKEKEALCKEKEILLLKIKESNSMNNI